MNDLDKNNRTRAMWCVLSSLILPVGVAIALGIKGCFLMLQDYHPIVLDRSSILAIALAPYCVVLISWLFPFFVLMNNQNKHSFVLESTENAFGFTLIVIGVWIGLIFPVTSIAIFIILDRMKIHSGFDYSFYIFAAIIIFHAFAIGYGGYLAAQGKIYKYPLVFIKAVLRPISIVIISIYTVVSPLIYSASSLAPDIFGEDVQRLGQIPFDANKWQISSSPSRSEPAIRAKMLRDISRNFKFKGQTSEEVTKVLGKPDSQEKSDSRNSKKENQKICYWLRSRGMMDAVIDDYLTFTMDKNGEILDYFMTTRSYDAGAYFASKEYKDSVDRLPCGKTEK